MVRPGHPWRKLPEPYRHRRCFFPGMRCAALAWSIALVAGGCAAAPPVVSHEVAEEPHAPQSAEATTTEIDPEAQPLPPSSSSLLSSPPAPGSSPSSRSSPRSRASLPESSRLAPLASPSPFVELPVQRHLPAVVSLPLGATSPRPVLVAAHGAGDRPEWQCSMWRGIVGNRAFILCPRGFPTNPYVPPEATGYFYTTHHALGREITLALEALSARFPEHADTKDPVFAGFSQGAIMGALLLPRHPARFARAALIEGGYGLFQEWNIPVAQAWQGRGGVRALLACGRTRCAEQARPSIWYMKRAGLDARVIHAEGAGHSYGGTMEQAVRDAFPWLIEGDPRF